MSFLNHLSIYLLFCCWVLCDTSAGMMCCYWLCACQINVSRSMQERILTARYNHLLAPSSFRYTDWVLHCIFCANLTLFTFFIPLQILRICLLHCQHQSYNNSRTCFQRKPSWNCCFFLIVAVSLNSSFEV